MAKLSDFQSSQNSNKGYKSQEEELKEKYESYKNMDQNQLHSQLYKEVARQKSLGTFDFNALSSMVDNLKGSLSENDYNNIKRILESLR